MDDMIHQLTVDEIDQIISFLQEPYPYELIKRLEKLKEETIFYIKMRNQKIIEDLDMERQLKEQGGWGTSPVSTAYFKTFDADGKIKDMIEEIRTGERVLKTKEQRKNE